MNAVWFVRSRQFSGTVKFLLTVTGYNPKENSLGEMIYLVYVLLFFAIWGLMVLALFASMAASFLQLPLFSQPAHAAGTLVTILVAGWWVVSLHRASRRSPLSFSETDATLICMTPVSRPAVILAGYASTSLTTGIPFWIISTVLAFGMVDLRLASEPTWANFTDYLGAALRFFLPLTLLVLGLLALSWALGCYRLQGDAHRRGLVSASLIAGAILTVGLVAGQAGLTPLNALAAPLGLPLLAGSGAGSFLVGVGVALAWLVIGLVALFWAARKVSLARMSQPNETSASLGTALLNPQAVQENELKKRLSSGSQPSRLPSLRREAALIWKKLVQVNRRGRLKDAGNWLLIFSISGAILLDPDWVSRWLLVLIWILRVQGLAARDVIDDLNMWTLSLGLPFRTAQRLVATVAPTALLATLLGWIALLLCQANGLTTMGNEAYLFLPLVALGVTAAAAYDVVSRTKAEHLLGGNIPAPGVLALLLGLLVVAANAWTLSSPLADTRLFGTAFFDMLFMFLLPRLLRSGYRKTGK